MTKNRAWQGRIALAFGQLSAVIVKRREEVFAALMWCAMVGVILLPALSQVGYAFYSMEYLVVAGASALVGLVFYFVSKIRYVGSTLLTLLTVLVVLLYFGAALLGPLWLQILVVTGLAIFMLFTIDKFRMAVRLRIFGFAACAQIFAMALAQPVSTVTLSEKNVAREDVPSVIHIMLDGHAGTAAFPRSAVSEDDVQRLENVYVASGFTVFRRAYSADRFTQLSMVRLFNPSFDAAALEQQAGRSSHQLVKAEILREISRKRAPDLTFSNYVDLRPSLRNVPNVARVHMFRAFGGVSTPGIRHMPISDRMWSAAALVRSWFMNTVRSPLVVLFFGYTETGRNWAHRLKPASWTNPLLGRSLLHGLTERLKCCGERGTYIFAHVISPHHPFVFDRSCHVLPSREWLNALNHVPAESDTMETRHIRWQRYYDQAVCVASDMQKLFQVINQRRELADATIIIHGDHGARIGIRNLQETWPEGYTAAIKEVDGRGTFLAIRIPGVLEGGVIETPVRFDEVYHQLAKNDFRDLDIARLKPGPDSPYADWAPDDSLAQAPR